MISTRQLSNFVVFLQIPFTTQPLVVTTQLEPPHITTSTTLFNSTIPGDMIVNAETLAFMLVAVLVGEFLLAMLMAAIITGIRQGRMRGRCCRAGRRGAPTWSSLPSAPLPCEEAGPPPYASLLISPPTQQLPQQSSRPLSLHGGTIQRGQLV